MWLLIKNKACKINEYLDIKKYSCKKRLFGKLVLACLLNDKKVTSEKINCLIQTISLVIIVIVCNGNYSLCY